MIFVLLACRRVDIIASKNRGRYEMKKTAFCFALALYLGFMCLNAFAMMSNPAAFEVSQPNGLKISLYIRGDEQFHWYEDRAGYTVVRDKGRYAYAQLGPDNRLVPTSLTVGIDNPKAMGLQKRILPPLSIRRVMKPS